MWTENVVVGSLTGVGGARLTSGLRVRDGRWAGAGNYTGRGAGTRDLGHDRREMMLPPMRFNEGSQGRVRKKESESASCLKTRVETRGRKEATR